MQIFNRENYQAYNQTCNNCHKHLKKISGKHAQEVSREELDFSSTDERNFISKYKVANQTQKQKKSYKINSKFVDWSVKFKANETDLMFKIHSGNEENIPLPRGSHWLENTGKLKSHHKTHPILWNLHINNQKCTVQILHKNVFSNVSFIMAHINVSHILWLKKKTQVGSSSEGPQHLGEKANFYLKIQKLF